MCKNLFGRYFIAFITIQALVLASSSNAWASCTYSNDAELAAQQTACAKDSSKQWDCKLNRCVTLQSVVDARAKAQVCLDMPETTDAELAAKKACMNQYAESETGVKGGQQVKGSGLAMGAYGLSVAMAVINLTAKKSNGSSCMSKTIFNASAVAAVAGELYQYFLLQKNLKKLQEEYKKGIIQKGASFEAQMKAFEYLRDEQGEIASIAKKKQILYTVLAAGYGAATAVAVGELIGWPKPPCESTNTSSDAKASNTNDQNTQTKPEAKADPKSGGATKAEGAFGKMLEGGAEIATNVGKSVLGNIGSSKGIAVAGGLCSGISFKLMAESKKTRENADKNKKLIEEIIKKFKDDMAQFCPNSGDRDDMNKPECFCYLSNGGQNPERVNSQTCKNFYAWKEHNYYKAAGNYNPNAASSTGCIDLSGNLDRDCSCKNVTNTKTGSNGCLKSNLSSVNLGSLGTMTSLPSVASQLDGIYSGNLSSAGDVDTSSIAKNAANTQRGIDSLLSQAKQKKISMPPIRNEGLQNRLISALAPKALLDKAQGGALSATNGNMTRENMPAVDEAIKKAGLNLTDYEGGAGKGAKKGSSGDGYFIPNMNNQESTTSGKVVEGFMNQERAFKDEDIVKDDGVPIWTIISNRYMTSGYRRLFEEETPSQETTSKEAVKQ